MLSNSIPPHTATHKTCSRCRVCKPRAAFTRHSSAPDGLQYWCRECRSAYAKGRPRNLEALKRWKANNPDKVREHSRRHMAKYRAKYAERIRLQRAEYYKRKKAERFAALMTTNRNAILTQEESK